MPTVVHLTTVHPRTDTRIRLKEARWLAGIVPGGVVLVVADGMGPEAAPTDGDVTIHDVGPLPAGRVNRVWSGLTRSWRAIRALEPTVVHFHDPEILPLAFVLKAAGFRVVYDVHENFPQLAWSREWMPALIRAPAAMGIALLEWLAARVFDRVVAATPAIAARFPRSSTVTIQNFPIQSELLQLEPAPYRSRPRSFCFVGYATRERGTREMVRAMEFLGDPTVRFELAGAISPPDLKAALEDEPGWKWVRPWGEVGRRELTLILGQVRAGLVLFHPLPNHVDSQPNKMFEYMSAGLPVIASDFPRWREIIDGARCGLLVDPEDPASIASAMRWILENPDEAEAMGQRGLAAVRTTYNWEAEARKLTDVYARLLPEARLHRG